MFSQYKIKTTQATIRNVAQSKEAAIKIVMEVENCPRNAIKSVKRLKTPFKM